MSEAGKAKQKAKVQDLDDRISDLADRCKLDSWTAFVNELKVPSDIAPAILTGRPELMALAQPRPLTQEECAVLYKLIGGLVETNIALREHAQQLAHFMHDWASAFKALRNVGERIERFANFKRSDDELDEAA